MIETAGQLSLVAPILTTLGELFLLGLVAFLPATFTPLPRVTLLLLAGLAVGHSGLDLLHGFV